MQGASSSYLRLMLPHYGQLALKGRHAAAWLTQPLALPLQLTQRHWAQQLLRHLQQLLLERQPR